MLNISSSTSTSVNFGKFESVNTKILLLLSHHFLNPRIALYCAINISNLYIFLARISDGDDSTQFSKYLIKNSTSCREFIFLHSPSLWAYFHVSFNFLSYFDNVFNSLVGSCSSTKLINLSICFSITMVFLLEVILLAITILRYYKI